MQRLFLAVLLLAILVGLIGALVLVVQDRARETRPVPVQTEGSNLQKLAFAALFLLVAGVSAGLLGGL